MQKCNKKSTEAVEPKLHSASADDASPAPLSARKRRSAQRLQEFQEKKRNERIAAKLAELRAGQWSIAMSEPDLEAYARRVVLRVEYRKLRRKASDAQCHDDAMSVESEAASTTSGSQLAQAMETAPRRQPEAG